MTYYKDITAEYEDIEDRYRITKAVAYMCMAKCAINAPVYTIDDTTPTSYSAFVGTDKSGKATASEEQGKTVYEMGKKINITLDGETRNAWETAVYCADQIASLGYPKESKNNLYFQNLCDSF